MSLSRKDAGGTLLVSGVGVLAVAAVREWASFLTVRWSIAGMIILGIGACAVGAYDTTNVAALYSITMITLVVAVVITAVLGLIFGNKAYVIILAALIGLLWLISTVRHAVI